MEIGSEETGGVDPDDLPADDLLPAYLMQPSWRGLGPDARTPPVLFAQSTSTHSPPPPPRPDVTSALIAHGAPVHATSSSLASHGILTVC